jgi:hypothetical protein
VLVLAADDDAADALVLALVAAVLFVAAVLDVAAVLEVVAVVAFEPHAASARTLAPPRNFRAWRRE